MTHIHLIGIGGSGLSAIARVLRESGYEVSGSDRVLSPLAQELMLAGVNVTVGHAPENIRGADLVVRSSAIPDNNPEVQAARAAGIPVLKRSEFLGQLMSDQSGIAIAGTHGKTTTTAMTAWVFSQLGMDPSYIIGGVSKDLGQNAHAGKGAFFVIEADEYDHMFLGLLPDLIVLTTLEYDHPDCFPTLEDYRQAFVDFIGHLKPDGALLANLEDEGSQAVLAQLPSQPVLWTYGTLPAAHYRAVAVVTNADAAPASRPLQPFRREASNVGAGTIQVTGRHNLYNALLRWAPQRMGLDPQKAAQALSRFSGTGRRFDLQGEVDGIAIIDDYAHHPTEIRATLAAARDRYPQQCLWAVWQPHTFTRTLSLLPEFCQSFQTRRL